MITVTVVHLLSTGVKLEIGDEVHLSFLSSVLETDRGSGGNNILFSLGKEFIHYATNNVVDYDIRRSCFQLHKNGMQNILFLVCQKKIRNLSIKNFLCKPCGKNGHETITMRVSSSLST